MGRGRGGKGRDEPLTVGGGGWGQAEPSFGNNCPNSPDKTCYIKATYHGLLSFSRRCSAQNDFL